MRWKAHFFINSSSNQHKQDRNTFGFKSRNHPKQCKELDGFEKDLLDMVKAIKFTKHTDKFQAQIKADISKIKESPNVFNFADKTNNLYETSPENHEKLLLENITKTYKKAPEKLEKSINLEAKSIAKHYQLEDRIDSMAKTSAYITLKDHKDNFQMNPSCRLINPAKNELGKISKILLERINKSLVKSLKVQQWKNTDDVIKWFNEIQHKGECTFIQLDIKEFYPSISEKLLQDAILFAGQYTTITPEETRIIAHCRKSLLYKNKEPWKKKTTESCFDVTMGSYDGAEICELIGSYILYQINEKINDINMGLYRDDGLILLRNTNKQQSDRRRKELVEIFKTFGFNIDIVIHLTSVNFLDVNFNLRTNSYEPYKKPNDTLKYVNVSSNHPPSIIRQLPQSIAERLSRNSSNERVFEKTKPEYESALRSCGYNESLKFKQPEKKDNTKQQRKRNVIWFNPPYSKNVKTDVAAKFLRLVDKHFPPNNKLHKIFDRNKVKVSYSCTRNISQIIKSHNSQLTQVTKTPEKACNCRDKPNCPVDGKCCSQDVVYKCLVTADNHPNKVYIGLAEGEWKMRFRNHTKSFKHRKYSTETALSQHVWKLKDLGVTPCLTWSIIKSVKPYSNISKKCSLCLFEKFMIITYETPDELLNKKTELISKCRHENKYLLKNYKNK